MKRLLLVDDDQTFCSVMCTAMKRRGFDVSVAHDVDEAKSIASTFRPEYALVDLKMRGKNGLRLIQYLHDLDASMRIVMLTGYASVATAVEAIKIGASNYLPKPSSVEEVLLAFGKTACDISCEFKPEPMSIKQIEWEQIQRVLIRNDGNITAAARELNMYRRTLQRKLAKIKSHRRDTDLD